MSALHRLVQFLVMGNAGMKSGYGGSGVGCFGRRKRLAVRVWRWVGERV